MNPIKISDLSSLSEMEEAILEINARKGEPIQLKNGMASSRRGAFFDASRLQVLTTWARHASNQHIHFGIGNDLNTVVEDLCNYSPGIAALRMSKGVVVGDASLSRRESLSAAMTRIKSADDGDFQSLLKGRHVDLICVSGAERQYLRPLFYAKNQSAVRSRLELTTITRQLLYTVSAKERPRVLEDFVRALATFFSELFSNTQQHATSDLNFNPYVEHVEGVIFGRWPLLELQHGSDFQGHPRLKEFWRREAVTTGDDKPQTTIRCLQMSFFDTGPGLAARISGRSYESMSMEEERQYLISCLGKHVTSKSAHGFGLGLQTVLTEVRRLGGLIRIRSGRHSIFNCFSEGDEATDLLDFQDWSSAQLGCVEGALFSVLIPLRGYEQ